MPIQPTPAPHDRTTVEPLVAVTEVELHGIAPDELAGRLARLEADRDLMLRLQLQGFKGKEWDAFLNVLAAYGRAVLYAWIYQGTIYRRCAEKRIRLGRSELRPRGGEVGDLATDVVVQAIISFREKVLVPGLWNSAEGATLKTYFVGQCLFQFPNAHRAWVARKRKQQQVNNAVTESGFDLVSRYGGNPALHVELRRELERARTRKDRARTIVIAGEMGYEQEEIGAELGLTRKAVEGALYRFRTKDEPQD